MDEAPDIPGADAVVAWFEYWPSFHDAEVLSITLDRSNPSRVVIHTFETTQEVDSRGYFVQRKHAIVTFTLEGFFEHWTDRPSPRIEGFNHQNVLGYLTVKKTDQGYELDLESVYGVDATLIASRISAELAPGIPPGSMYQPKNS